MSRDSNVFIFFSLIYSYCKKDLELGVFKMTTIKVLEGSELEKIVTKPLIDALTTMNKYSVLPVYSLQFIIDKSNMLPYPTLVAYDNKSLITEASSLTPHLEDVIHEKSPKTITPAVIVYPEGIDFSTMVVGSENYHFSSSYLIVGKELKDNLKNSKLELVRATIVSDIGRMNVETKLEWKFIPYQKATDDIDVKTEAIVDTCVSDIPFTIKPLHLPFKNYLKISKSLTGIIDTIANIATLPNLSVIDDPKELSELFNIVKEDQMIDFPTANVKLFKDFMKVKPTKATVIYTKGNFNNDTEVTSVFFEMYFKANHYNVGIFYRYLDNIFDTLSGEYTEE